MHPIWHPLFALHHRIDALIRRCERLEAQVETERRLCLLQRQVAQLKAELEVLKAAPRQIVIEKLENTVGILSVNTLNGILNVGVAHNATLPVEEQPVVCGKPLADLVNPEAGASPSPDPRTDTPSALDSPSATSSNGGRSDAQNGTNPEGAER